MSADLSAPGTYASRGTVGIGSEVEWLRVFAILSGIGAALLFVLVGLRFELQQYADGSLFSYAVAARDSWAFHWHNISGRLVVYLFCHVPAEFYVRLTGDARGGIDVYGFLFFASQLLGLVATFAADRSRDRVIFLCACLSAACLCPLVFGYPTEMWFAHALFWPTLAIAHSARGIGGFVLVVAAFVALVLTHEGAVLFAIAVLATTLLRGLHDRAPWRAAGAFLIALAIWGLVRITLRPDDYFAGFLPGLASNFISLANLTSAVLLLVLATLACYAAAFWALRRWLPRHAQRCAMATVAAGLTAYWLWFDHALLSEDRYALRTALLILTPAWGMAAAWLARGRDAPNLPLRVRRAIDALRSNAAMEALAGAAALVMLIHAVETAKFVRAWTDYRGAVRALAVGTHSDPALGDARLVSAERIGQAENRLSWASTTPFLSVLVAPDFAPSRLVVEPGAQYMWFSCAAARANEAGERAVPREARQLIRVYTCLHR